MLASGEFCLIDFEGNDRFGIVAGVEISGADGVKNWLDLCRHFHSGEERFEIRRGLGVIASLGLGARRCFLSRPRLFAATDADL